MFNTPMNLILPGTIILWKDYRLGNNNRIVFYDFLQKVLISIRNTLRLKKKWGMWECNAMVYVCLLLKQQQQIGTNGGSGIELFLITER